MVRNISKSLLRRIDGYHTKTMPPAEATGCNPALAVVHVAASAIAWMSIAKIKPNAPPLSERTPGETEWVLNRLDGVVRNALLCLGFLAFAGLCVGAYFVFRDM